MSYDPEGPTPDIDGDLLDESEDATPASKPCEECGDELHADADVCPKCGAFQIGSGAARRSMSWKIGVALALVAAVLMTWYWAWRFKLPAESLTNW